MTLEATIAEHVEHGVTRALEKLNLTRAPGDALTTSQVAQRLNCKRNFVAELIREGHIVAWRTHGSHGDYRINESDLHAYQLRRAEEAKKL